MVQEVNYGHKNCTLLILIFLATHLTVGPEYIGVCESPNHLQPEIDTVP